MGHVPSKEFCAEPFAMDVLNKNGPRERLVAIALTKYYFPSVDDPLFQKFCQVRKESHVRNWYWRPTGVPLDVLPDAPTDAQIYQYYIQDASTVVDANLPPNKFTPLPVLIVKMNEADSTLYPTGDNSVVVGCIGTRHFEIINQEGKFGTAASSTTGGGDGSNLMKVQLEQERGITQLFMSNPFYNEIKAISCFRLGCACYKFYCRKAGLDAAPWPICTGYETHTGNLPFFRLIHQLNFLVHDQAAWVDDGLMCIEKGDRIFLGVEGVSLATGAEGLGNSVDRFDPDEEKARAGPKRKKGGSSAAADKLVPAVAVAATSSSNTKHVVCSHRIKIIVSPVESVLPQPLTRKLDHLEKITARAKAMWKDANRAVAVYQVPKKKRSSTTPGDVSGIAVELTPPKTTPDNSSPVSPTERAVGALPSAEEVERPPDCMTLEEFIIKHNNSVASVFTFDGNAAHAELNPSPPRKANVTVAPTTCQLQGRTTVVVGGGVQSRLSAAPSPIFPANSPGRPTSAENLPPQAREGPGVVGSMPAWFVGSHPNTGPSMVSTGNGTPSAGGGGPPRLANEQQFHANTDPRVFIGDRTPVTIRTQYQQWVPKFWRLPLQAMARSNWQPHLEHGFVCYVIDHSTMCVYDADWVPEVLLGCSPYLFLIAGETLYSVAATGEYVPGKAA